MHRYLIAVALLIATGLLSACNLAQTSTLITPTPEPLAPAAAETIEVQSSLPEIAETEEIEEIEESEAVAAQPARDTIITQPDSQPNFNTSQTNFNTIQTNTQPDFTIAQIDNTPCVPATTTWSAQYTIVSGDTLYTLARLTGTDVDSIKAVNCITDASAIPVGTSILLPEIPIRGDGPGTGPGPAGNSVPYFLISDTADETATQVGCGQYAIPRPSGIPISTDAVTIVQSGLNALFADPGTAGQNFWTGASLQAITLNNGLLTVDIQGGYKPVGVCADAAAQAQLLMIVFNTGNVDRALVRINGQNMKQLLDATGLAGPNDTYLRTDQ